MAEIVLSMALALLLCSAPSLSKPLTQGSTPEQIHLSFGATTNEIVVMWAQSTQNSSNTSCGVRFGVNTTDVRQTVIAESWQFTEGNPDGVQWMFRAKLAVRDNNIILLLQSNRVCHSWTLTITITTRIKAAIKNEAFLVIVPQVPS